MVQRKKVPKSNLSNDRSRGPCRNDHALLRPIQECLGADVNALVTQSMVGIAKRQLGTVPQFWGRYFKGPGDQDPVRYQAQLEGPILDRKSVV